MIGSMLRSAAAVLSPPPPLASSGPAAFDLSRPRRRPSTVMCGAPRSRSSIPKMEPFNRSRMDRCIKDPPFLQKCENELSEYCTKLEGDDSYSCWRAYFELKDLEKEMPREDVERFVRQAGGKKSLIGCLHGITAMQKSKDKKMEKPVMPNTEAQGERPFPIPDGLPKTQEELDDEEKARMPDSPFTRLLRSKGRLPAWFSQAPDHETD